MAAFVQQRNVSSAEPSHGMTIASVVADSVVAGAPALAHGTAVTCDVQAATEVPHQASAAATREADASVDEPPLEVVNQRAAATLSGSAAEAPECISPASLLHAHTRPGAAADPTHKQFRSRQQQDSGAAAAPPQHSSALRDTVAAAGAAVEHNASPITAACFVERGGLRFALPYWFDFRLHAKKRMAGRHPVDVFATEFPVRPRCAPFCTL